MTNSIIPFDPDFDEPHQPLIHFVFGVIAGITLAAIIAVIIIIL